MSNQPKQPISLTLPRVASWDEHGTSFVTRGGALALANLLFFLSSPALPGSNHQRRFPPTPAPSETAVGNSGGAAPDDVKSLR